MRYQEVVTKPIYNIRDWPAITGMFGYTADLIDGMHVIGRSHTMRSVDEVERWARNQARIDAKPIRWRYFTSTHIIACGIENP